MVNQEILGGLRAAVEKGESLQKAMMTFYNSGYPKKEVEQAARALKKEGAQKIPQSSPKKVSSYGSKNEVIKKEKVKQNKTKKIKNKTKPKNWLLISLVIVSILFVGFLTAFFIFK